MKSVKVWDIFVRTFHWALVGSTIGLYLSGEDFKGVHIRLGYFVTCLVLSRVIWGFIGTKHARFTDFLYRPGKIYQYLKSLIGGNPTHYIGHNPAGGLMIIVMLLSLLVTAFTGLKTLANEGQGPLADTGEASILQFAYADEDEHDDDDQNRIGYVTLNRPDALNALDDEINAELWSVWDDFAKDDSLDVAILTDAGKAFCSGADLKTFIPKWGKANMLDIDYTYKFLFKEKI